MDVGSPSSHCMSQSSSYSSNQSSGVFSAVTSSTQHTTASFHRHSTHDAASREQDRPTSTNNHTSDRDTILDAQDMAGQSSPSTPIGATNVRKKRMLPSPRTEQHLLQSPSSIPSPHEASSRSRYSRAPVSSSTFDPATQSTSMFPPPQTSGPGSSRASRHFGERPSPAVAALPSLASGAVSNRVAQFQAALRRTDVEDQRSSIASALSMETVSPNPTFYPLERHLAHPQLLLALLPWLTFKDLLPIFSLTAYTRNVMENRVEIKEAILERFLTDSVGYRRWAPEHMGSKEEPLALSLRVCSFLVYLNKSCSRQSLSLRTSTPTCEECRSLRITTRAWRMDS